MMMTSWKQNDDDIINFFHEFEVSMIHMILLPSFKSMCDARISYSVIWGFIILGVQKKSIHCLIINRTKTFCQISRFLYFE